MAVLLGPDDVVPTNQEVVVVLRGRIGSQVERARVETLRHVEVDAPGFLNTLRGPFATGEMTTTVPCRQDDALGGYPSKCPDDFYVVWVQGPPYRAWRVRELRGSLAALGLSVRADVFTALGDGGPHPLDQLADVTTTVIGAAGDTLRGAAEGTAGAASTFAWLAPFIGPLLVLSAVGIAGAVVVFLVRNPGAAARLVGAS